MFKQGAPILLLIFVLSLIINFGPIPPVKAQSSAGDNSGTLQFVANGEDFIRQGFTSKDGWNITFDEVLVNISDVAAMQTSPPFDPDLNNSYTASAVAQLDGSYVVDLAAGGEDAGPILVDEVEAAAGQYNALTWNTVPAAEGELAGYAILLKGAAEKEGETLDFVIGVETGYNNMCGEFVGDTRKGILQPGETAEVEMTFHFDHIFGDAGLPADDSLNQLAPGFEPFASVAQNGVVETDLIALADALPEEQYQMLLDILPTLGHTGEGHCNYQELGALTFTANGEDFIRQGFTSKDGWNITFDELLVNISNAVAAQTSPPFDPGVEEDVTVEAVAALPGSAVVDLAAGDENAAPIQVDTIAAPVVQYNALSWQTAPAAQGELAGYAILMKGSAEKEGQAVDFTIGFEQGYENLCGEFVGDTRKGIMVSGPGAVADVEMTFHFDHIFGNANLPADDSLNELAPGFEPFASVAQNGVVETDLTALADALPEEQYQMLVDILPTLGHTGEGHCTYFGLGELAFTANGEDFIRQGFTSKDGWDIAFDRVLVHLTDITAFQANPPYEPGQETGLNAQYQLSLAGNYVVDLAEGDENADPIFADAAPARAGRYNALHWKMTPAAGGELAGNSILLTGTAQKDGQSITFNIGIDESYSNTCGDFVGDTRKGILQPGAVADVEMTFHFDHIFGDAGLPADDSLNQLAPGFAPFASVAQNGAVDVRLSDLAEMLPEADYQMLVDILPTLGHTGEGHCLYDEVGELAFTANGEDFIRQGFTSKDGWDIAFDHVWVNLSNITAYQTNPPYDPDEMGANIEAEQVTKLPGSYVADLAAGDENAAPIPVDQVIAPAGRYNALSWQMVPAAEGDMAGYSLLLSGTAAKAGRSLPFTIGIEESYSNTCGEFVGDERKGILQPGAAADVEMTFHFDHIFGDANLPADDSLNQLAPGFESFASVAQNGAVETDLTALADALPEEQYQMLVDILPTLGHTGEGHCFYGQ